MTSLVAYEVLTQRHADEELPWPVLNPDVEAVLEVLGSEGYRLIVRYPVEGGWIEELMCVGTSTADFGQCMTQEKPAPIDDHWNYVVTRTEFDLTYRFDTVDRSVRTAIMTFAQR